MPSRIAAYPASLDPITNGHMNIIERTAPLYDKLLVVVAVDSRKTYTFSPVERVEMVKAATTHLPNVMVTTCIDRYVVRKAYEAGARVLIRGLRNFKDLEDEQTLASENRAICPEVETVLIPCLPELMHVSSSMVKGHVGVDPTWEHEVARSVPLGVLLALKNKLVFMKARRHWTKLMNLLGNPVHTEETFQSLLKQYGEAGRYYHILAHIVSMLDELEAFGDYDSAVALAIWFHDVIYDSRSPDNEFESAHVARMACHHMDLKLEITRDVPNLILATKHAEPPQDAKSQLIVDLDLMILGKPEAEFDAYELNVRKEYEWVPEPDFRKGRAKILQSFLDRPTIYSLPYFQEKYEAAARANLARSIGQLQG